MSEEKRPEASGTSDQTSDSSSSSAQPRSADPRRGNSADMGGSGSGGGGRHGSRRRHRGDRDSSQPPRRLENSINLDELRELTDLIVAQGFTEFELEKEGFHLRLSRNTYTQAAMSGTAGASAPAMPLPAPPPSTASSSMTASPVAAAPAPVATAITAIETPGVSAGDELFKITSPIVGTFYRAPSPASEVFVKQGSRVEVDTVVCIIEAMKLMNEIQAEVSGTIEKIYVENGQPVEYGQALFGIKK